MVIIPSSCVGGRQSVPDMQVWDAVSSPPLPSKLQLSFHQQQWWECRLGSQEHFWKLFSQLLITGSNYKFLVGTLRRQLDIFERLFFFHDPWRWQGLTRRKAENAEIPHVRDWHKPFLSLWILHFLVMWLCSETSTFLTFNHWTKPSTKVLVEKWNETKYLASTFKETEEKGGIWLRTHVDHWHKSNQFRLIFITQCQLLWKSCRKKYYYWLLSVDAEHTLRKKGWGQKEYVIK